MDSLPDFLLTMQPVPNPGGNRAAQVQWRDATPHQNLQRFKKFWNSLTARPQNKLAKARLKGSKPSQKVNFKV